MSVVTAIVSGNCNAPERRRKRGVICVFSTWYTL